MKFLFIPLCILVFLFSCSRRSYNSLEEDTVSYTRELTSHEETLPEEGTILTKVEEQIEGTVRILRVSLVRDGQVKKMVYYLDSPNFEIKIPISKQIELQSSEDAAKHPDPAVTAFVQNLEKAREKMLETDYVAALSAVNKALQIDEKNPQAHMMRGSIYYAMGRIQEAEQEFDLVLKLQPENQEVKKFREYLQAKEDARSSNPK